MLQIKTKNIKNGWKILVTVLLIVCVFAAFWLFLQDNKRRATSISTKSLKEATVRSSFQIDESLNSAKREILLVEALYGKLLEDEEVTATDLKKVLHETSFDYIGYATENGEILNEKGEKADISGRDYFKDAIKGNSGVSVVFHSAFTKEPLLIFYTPFYIDGKAKGVIVGCYKEGMIEEILHNTFMGERTRNFLCMNDGTIIASNKSGLTNRSIFEDGIINKGVDAGEKAKLKEALSAGREYEFQYEGQYGKSNAYVMKLGTSNWMLVQTYPSIVTNQFVQDANTAGIYLLVELFVIFLVGFILSHIVNAIQRKKLTSENKDQSYIIDGVLRFFSDFILIDLVHNTYQYLEGKEANDNTISKQGSYEYLKESILDNLEEEEEREQLEELLSKEVMQKKLTNHPFYRYEYRMKGKCDKWDGINLVCIERAEGVPVKVLLAHSDVTDIKKSEMQNYEALKQAYEAVENANRAKSDFLSSMSHDIRTPMNAIMGMTTIASMNLDNKERVKDCLNKITVSSQHLLGLINEVLDMSKIESGKLNFAEDEFNLADLVENMVTMFLTQTQEKNQHFHVSAMDIQNEEVVGDSMRLQQIFVNILGNAVKFTPEGGTISFHIKEKPSNMYGCGCYVFTFRDTGVGMDEKFMERIFEPFTRAKDSRTNKIEGTGLGMSIVKNLVQMMNGDIQVKSKVNEGSEFTVTVYLKLNQNKRDDVEGLKNLSILVVDDDEAACESTCAMLNEIGMMAEGVCSGVEAIDKLSVAHGKENGYVAAIIDWKMPGMDGMETTRIIRNRLGKEMPVIILSAFDYSEIEQEARDVGVNAFISKPLFRSRLIYIMKSLLYDGNDEYTEIDKLQDTDYSTRRVLVVEDNEINMEIAKELLTETGVKVEGAENGRLAVERVCEMPAGYYDLIFMDIQMPEMNGYDAAAAIRAAGREDLKKIPIVAMSADVFMDDIKRAQDVGMNGHVPKPVQIEDLLKALEKM